VKKYTIIWDFDGTILPSDPYDSEQATVIYILHQMSKRIHPVRRLFANAMIYADMKKMLRRRFKKFFAHFLINTKVETIDGIARILAKKISIEDRETFVKLKQYGHYMIVISCGTVDLSERILRYAGIESCFNLIEGNRLKVESDHIVGMDFHIPDPEDKLKLIKQLPISQENTIAIGDGYTDRPLLDWAKIAVLIDRAGEQKARYSDKKYLTISSINEIIDIAEKFLH